MGFRGILRYTASALLFALAVCGLWALWMRLRGRRIHLRALATVGYIAALVQITGLRLCLRSWSFAPEAPQLIPLATTIGAWQRGLWPFLYHVLGNLLWFVPLGLLCERRGAVRILLLGAALSGLVEILQYLLGTGQLDVDDLLLNALGALVGYGLRQLALRNAQSG